MHPKQGVKMAIPRTIFWRMFSLSMSVSVVSGAHGSPLPVPPLTGPDSNYALARQKATGRMEAGQPLAQTAAAGAQVSLYEILIHNLKKF